MPGKPSDIPVGTQFSPNLINLKEFLAAIVAHSGNKEEMMEAIWQPSVRIEPPSKSPTKRRRSLPLEAAVQYELLGDGSYHATDLAKKLAALPDEKLDGEFAKHILLNLGGLRVVEAAQRMKLEGVNITGDTLASYLTSEGFHVVVHNTAINSLRMWLARADIFGPSNWDVDQIRKRELLGLDDDEIAALVGLTDEQKAFAIALCRINPSGPYQAAEVRTLAESILGRGIARASLPKIVLDPLKEAGLLDYESGGTSGGKSSILKTSERFKAELLTPFLERTTQSMDAALMAYYKRSPSDIYKDLASKKTDVKGRALEAYAIHIMRLMGLRFVAWRKRAQRSTGGAEVDVIMAGLQGGLPTLWQVQCKNTPAGQVRLEDVAKEVGLTPITKATHVMLLANCKFTSDAVVYSQQIMRNSPLVIFLLDHTDFDRVKAHPGDLPLLLRAKAEEWQSVWGQEKVW